MTERDAVLSILLVDDEPKVLSGLSRQLRGQFLVHVANSGAEALALLATHPEVAVLVTDMRMPQMDGATLCSLVRARFPNIVRIILSGQSDFQASLKAVNEGQIYRFLTKPVGRDKMIEVLTEAAHSHSQRTAEKRVLEETLHGAVHALGDVLAMGSPDVFGRVVRLRQLVSDFCVHCGVADWWEIEVAALFSQIGWVTVPPTVIARFDASEELNPAESDMIEAAFHAPDRVLARIPRLDDIRTIVRYCRKNFDGTGTPDGAGGEHIPWGARLLRLMSDLDQLEVQGHSMNEAAQILGQRPGRYDPSLLRQLIRYVGAISADEIVREMAVHELRPGYRFVAPVLAKTGVLLVAQGQSVTDELLARLENYSCGVGVREPLTVATPIRQKATGTEG